MGTRPEIIKLSPLIHRLGKRRCSVVFSGQHYDYKMGLQFIQQLDLPNPNYSMRLSQKTPPLQISEIISKLSKILSKEKPDTVIVQGDTNTVLAASICSIKHNIPISHIESGLRSFDWRMPEEHNRITVDHLSEILFAPTKNAKNNLISENVHGTIHVVGNTVIDAVNTFSKISHKKTNVDITIDDYILTTLHRSENVDNQKILSQIIHALLSCNEEIIFPIHPRTKKRLKEFHLYEKLVNSKNIMILDAVGYFEMLELMKHCKFILTDSGGLQEEATAPSIRKKTIVMRKTTDRPETISTGFSELVGVSSSKILSSIKKSSNFPEIIPKNSPYGSGNSSERIVHYLQKTFNS